MFPTVAPSQQDRLMHRRITVLALLAAVAVSACAPDVAVAPKKAPKSPSLAVSAEAFGNYIVMMKGNGISKDFAQTVARLGGKVTASHSKAGFAAVSGLTAEGASELAATSGVAEVELDAEVALAAPIETAQADVTEILSDPSIQSQDNPATAALGTWQWNMKLIGADALWVGPLADRKLGSSSVRVAILDTGIDYDNRDFFRAATATVPQARLVDLSTSTSFVPSDEAIRTNVVLFPAALNLNPIADFHGHGTNVASQVSSLAFAFAGVTSRTTLVGVKVLSARGSGSLSGVLNGVLWAADHDVDVANMSLGSEFSKAGNGRLVSLINRVFNYAKQRGMLIVVAAGNADPGEDPIDIQHNGNQFVNYCDAPHVVCVAAVGPIVVNGLGDIPSFFSYYGKSKITVAAPGGNAGPTVTAWPWGNGNASGVWSFCSRRSVVFSAEGVPSLAGCQSGGFVTGMLGTSQAAPHVAGLAALLVEKYGKGQPQTIKQLIVQSSDPIDPAYGRGRISVKNALGL
jgi:subtilisin family serine protease